MLKVDILKRLPDYLLKASFSVAAGELLVLAGPSGSGKTTILESLAGLQRPDAGNIKLNNQILFSSIKRVDVPTAKRNIGFVFQSYALFEHLTVEGNVRYATRGIDKPARTRRIKESMERFGIGYLRERFPAQLSGGERQRVALARVLAQNPAALFLDEPLAALDRKLREQLRQDIARLPGERNIPVILVTHCSCEERLATRVLRPQRNDNTISWMR
ncbi:MAG: ATP-binding cassette domain-containing protein [Ammonifex sp.]|jgi:molybdate transport system ATP-binding protein|nr:MAG: ATP-binding cassette domain-containing protein [Ammonifex sp.]